MSIPHTESSLPTELAQFTGSENIYCALGATHFTEGVLYLANTARCHWLIDAIASYQPGLTRRVSQFSGEPGIEFQIWLLRVNTEAKTAVLTCHEDWDEDSPSAYPELVRQEIPYTDFPLPEIKLYCENRVLMLPSER